MLHEYKLPSLGDGVSGKVTEIMVKPGDSVSLEQIVLVVGTDKVDAEMPIDAAGIVEEILVKKGDEVTEGSLVMKIKTADTADVSGNAPASVSKVAAASTEIVAATPPPATPPPATPPPATLPPATPPPVAASAPSTSAAAEASAAPASAPSGPLRSSPLARKRAKEFGVNLSDVHPIDGASRVSYKDVVDFVKKKLETGGGSSMSGGTVARRALPDFTKFGATERKAQTNVGVKTSEAMSYSTNTIPHAYISEKADITRLEALRQQYKEQVKTAGGSLTMTAILTKAVAILLRRMPQFNASLDVETNEVIFKKYINIGIAVDTPAGLYVPNIKQADQKNLTELSVDLADIGTRTKGGKITMNDITGGTFTISNIGGIGGTNMLSIVNWPEVAILSIAAAQMEPVWNEATNAFEPRLMMPMTIGWDHRVINGGDAARFLVELKRILEEPFAAWL